MDLQRSNALTNDWSNGARMMARRAAHSCAFQLAVYGGASAVIYIWALARAYSLFDWWMSPQRTIAKIAGYDGRAGLSHVAAFAALFGLYLLALRCAKFEVNARMLGVIVGGAAIFNLVLLGLYPVDSADIFDNILRGRMTALYGLNPFVEVPKTVIRDPFYLYAGWKYFPSAYGPLWELVAATVARVAGDSIVGNVIAFKLLSVAAYAGTGALVMAMLREIAPARLAYGAVFVLWNPLVLYATAGNGHNDAVMFFCVTLAFYFLLRRHFTAACAALTAGALIKFIPALLLPLCLVAAFKALRTRRARAQFVLTTTLVCGAGAWLAYARFAHAGAWVNLDWRWDLFTTSLATWVWLAAQQFASPQVAAAWVMRAGFAMLGVFLLLQLVHVWRKTRRGEFLPYVRAALWLLLFYLLATTTWFQEWYVTWLIALAALLPDSFLSRGVVLLSAAGLWKMPWFDFLLVRNVRPAPPRAWREVWLTLGVLGVPWLYFVYGIWKRRI